ncbi:hypothetical protein [Rheinheimera metallidurans]|uniref:hypothetical protein n=1 Tax=Rheinheimera metallidurans TaxID=2925781 RepID=UPI0030022638
MAILKNSLFTFFLGFLLAGLVSVWMVRNLFGSFSMDIINDAVYKYEMAVQQSDREEIIKRLNASISCAINGYEEYVSLGISTRMDSHHYSYSLEKAYALRDEPCEYPLIVKSD